MRSYQILDENGQPLGFGCGPTPPTAGDIAIVREYAEELRIRKATPVRCTNSGEGLPCGWCDDCRPAGQLRLEPVQCRCPHGEDWHSVGGCEARGCACEVEPR